MNNINGQEFVLPELEVDLDIIQKLDDEPNDVGGMSAAELKATFDQAGNAIKRYINEELLPRVSDTVAEAEIRTEAEAERVAQEEGREKAETLRDTAEQERATAEEQRATAEQGRADEEQKRAAAEIERATAEQGRTDEEAARVRAEQGRVEAEKARAAAERERADENTGIVARATIEADRAKYEADRARAISGGDFATRLEMNTLLREKAGLSLVGPASLVEQLMPGGILFVTDEGNVADYAVTLDDLLTEGDRAYSGGEDRLAELLTVGRVKVLNLRADEAGNYFTESALSALAESIRALCAAAQAGGVYVYNGNTAVSWWQVQHFLLFGDLVSHSGALGDNWPWARDALSTMAKLVKDMEDLRALIGDFNAMLDEVNGEVPV